MRTNDTVVLKFKDWILHGNNTVSPAPSRFEIYHRSGTYCVIGPDATIYGIFSDEMQAVNNARCLNKAYDLGIANEDSSWECF